MGNLLSITVIYYPSQGKTLPMPLLFDFEWSKDAKGYRLVDPEPARPPPIVHPDFQFEIPPTLLEKIGKPQRVVPNGGNSVTYRPLNKFGELYKAFASVRAPEDVRLFMQNYGPLTEAGLQPDRGEDVSFVLEHAEAFRSWLNASKGRRTKVAALIGNESVKFANLEASLKIGPSGVLQLRILPKNLLSALWVQLAETLAGGAKIRSCTHCGQWFEAGPGTGRRLDAKFCSEEHQIHFNSLKRSKGD
jgi:hypothetical protein